MAAIAIATACGLALPLLTADPPSAEAKGATHHSLRSKQKHVRTQEKRVQNSLDGESKALTRAEASLISAQHQLAGARARLLAVDVRLARARRADADLRTQLAVSRAQLQQARSDMSTGAADVDTQRAAARKAILGSYETGDPGLLEMQSLADADSLDVVMTEQAYDAAINQLQANRYQSLQASQVLLSVRATDVARATTQVAVMEKTAAAKVAQIDALQQQAKRAETSITQLVARRRTASQEAAAAKAHDTKRLKSLQAQDAKIQARILAQAGHGSNRIVTSGGGLFMSPVAHTYITSPYGWRLNPVMHYWGLHDGDDLHAPCGTPEVAVGPGKVVAEYYSDVWGNRLFFDLGRVNGANWVAIYNHITAYKAHVGDVAAEGQTLAYAGTTGWSTGCHLHFTLTKNGTAVDPTKLIGLG